MAELVDSHCHLDFPDFDGETDALIARARDAGVTRLVSICTRIGNEPKVRAIAEAHEGVFYTFGVHPMYVTTEPKTSLEELVRVAAHPKMIGIGETGLDYHYTPESAGLQKDSLEIHIAAAQETGLPLIIHSRDADQDMAEMLEAGYRHKAFGCVMHCYTSGPELARRALDLGFYLSMSGIAAFPKSQEIRDIFAAAPLDRVLVETDAPYLAPPPYRGKRNEPAYVAHTAKVGAQVFDLRVEDFARVTSDNFDRLFPKAKAWANSR